jgi:hypothetical protein
VDQDLRAYHDPAAPAKEHGRRCSCRLLAAAANADPSAIDFAYCSRILQKRWRMECDHFPRLKRTKRTPELPFMDSRNAVHAALVANADIAIE